MRDARLARKSLPTRTQYLGVNTPVEAPAVNQCGRVVFTDVHVGTAVTGSPGDRRRRQSHNKPTFLRV